MKVTHTSTVSATPDEVMRAMLAPSYLDQLVAHIDTIDGIEEIERSEGSDESITRVLRYSAPTAGKIPSFLKKYSDKAPSHVHWREQGEWDTRARRYTYAIVAEVPDDWQRYYASRGSVELCEAEGGAATEVVASLDVEVKVFGLSRLIERAARGAVRRRRAIASLAVASVSATGCTLFEDYDARYPLRASTTIAPMDTSRLLPSQPGSPE